MKDKCTYPNCTCRNMIGGNLLCEPEQMPMVTSQTEQAHLKNISELEKENAEMKKVLDRIDRHGLTGELQDAKNRIADLEKEHGYMQNTIDNQSNEIKRLREKEGEIPPDITKRMVYLEEENANLGSIVKRYEAHGVGEELIKRQARIDELEYKLTKSQVDQQAAEQKSASLQGQLDMLWGGTFSIRTYQGMKSRLDTLEKDNYAMEEKMKETSVRLANKMMEFDHVTELLYGQPFDERSFEAMKRTIRELHAQIDGMRVTIEMLKQMPRDLHFKRDKYPPIGEAWITPSPGGCQTDRIKQSVRVPLGTVPDQSTKELLQQININRAALQNMADLAKLRNQREGLIKLLKEIDKLAEDKYGMTNPVSSRIWNALTIVTE